ncbi:MAG: CARDB domain-containing protein [Armatimonadota bacterium]
MTDVSWIPASPAPGDAITMKATIRNQGTGATPAGVIHGVAFTADGNLGSAVWSDSHTASIAPGEWITVTANGGVDCATWTAGAGTHTVTATVDDVDRMTESKDTK